MSDFEKDMGPENVERFKLTSHAVNQRAMLALKEVWNRMPWDQVFDLPGGEQAIIKKFVEPRMKDGAIEFGFDVRDTHDDWHLEFFVTKTGWGGKPIGEITIQAKPDKE